MPKLTSYTMLTSILVLSFLLVFCIDTSFGGDTLQKAACSNSGNYAANSSYEASLSTLLSSLAANASANNSKKRFFNTNVDGHDEHGRSYTIFGLYLCRGDDVDRDCQTCVPKATHSILQECPTRPVVATVWYVDCMVRYSNESIFGKADYSEPLNIPDKRSGNMSTKVDEFNDLVGSLMQNLAISTSKSAKRYATKEAIFTSFWTVYSEAQCTPDLSTSDCQRCLTAANNVIPDCCSGSKGAQVLTPTCYARYNIRPFYTHGPSPSSPLPLLPPPNPALPIALAPSNHSPTTTSKGKGERTSTITIALVALVGFFIVQVSILIYLILRRRKKRLEDVEVFHQNQNQVTHRPDDNDFPNVDSLQYDLTLLQIATNFFSGDNKLGEGGFGGVYKGVLSNGQEIAVKRLSVCSNHGVEQFKNEVAFVAKLQHRNLVRLLGFCLAECEKLLVYEYVPNKSLDFILFDPIRREELDWPTRYKIISGIARGMLYLHEDSRLRIVHRDLKASNILLDSNMNPKISDFGTAKHFNADESQANTSRVAGTFGYMAPEYLLNGEFSLKTDVYSFGVLVLEIVTGKKSTINFRQSGENLLTYAWKHWTKENLLEIMDSSLKESYCHNEVKRCTQLGLLCVQGDSENRPTMASVVFSLNSDYVLPMPYHPGLLICNNIESNAEVKELESDESTSRLMRLSISSEASAT